MYEGEMGMLSEALREGGALECLWPFTGRAMAEEGISY